MDEIPVANGRPPKGDVKSNPNVNGTAIQPQSQPQPQQPKKPRPKKRGPNYTQIHSKPLPLQAYPLPAFHPSNPLSLLRIAYVYLSQLLYPPSSHARQRYVGHLSPETRSVHVTDPTHIRALWEMGFFGKGTLSRSEPSWLDREKARLKAERSGRMTAEEATNARRDERRLFKLERARAERERIERQKAVEEGRADELVEPVEAEMDVDEESRLLGPQGEQQTPEANGHVIEPAGDEDPRGPALDAPRTDLFGTSAAAVFGENEVQDQPDLREPEPDISNQEHLQLTFEEAFFLHYGLGVLEIRSTETSTPTTSSWQLLTQFINITDSRISIIPDSQFLLSYVVHHHFRSLGWVVRSGVKFGIDYLLYNRGPVFSHAEFAILIMPAYSDPYWSTEEGKRDRRVKEQKDWWWLHCVNRVQSQVKKTLVLCYVEVPAPLKTDEEGDVGKLLRRYKIREFIVRRWLANRSRD